MLKNIFKLFFEIIMLLAILVIIVFGVWGLIDYIICKVRLISVWVVRYLGSTPKAPNRKICNSFI